MNLRTIVVDVKLFDIQNVTQIVSFVINISRFTPLSKTMGKGYLWHMRIEKAQWVL